MSMRIARPALLILYGLLLATVLLIPTGAAAQTTVKYVHTDALGSVVAMTDTAGTIVEGHREYEAYGQQLTPVVQDGPGYTGHVQDAATGLTYMQQRYYDSQMGVFLSADPVTAYGRPITAFNRYRYGNNNPFKFFDPDGRQSCRTGTRICMGDKKLQAELAALNKVTAKHSHKSEGQAGRYFSRLAIPLQQRSGREIGANMEQRSETDFRVIDFHADPGSAGAGGVSTLPYDGMFTWKGILHTHPTNNAFSGLGVYGYKGRYHNLYIDSDAQQAVQHEVNNYLATPDGSLQKLDYERWNRDVKSNGGSEERIYANDYVDSL